MFNKIAKSADEIFKALAGMAFDPKVVAYVVKLPSVNKKGNRYEVVKVAAERDHKKPKAKTSIIQTPTQQPFNPSKIVSTAIQKEHSVPPTFNPNVVVPKPTYDSKSAGLTFKTSQTVNAPMNKVLSRFKFK